MKLKMDSNGVVLSGSLLNILVDDSIYKWNLTLWVLTLLFHILLQTSSQRCRKEIAPPPPPTTWCRLLNNHNELKKHLQLIFRSWGLTDKDWSKISYWYRKKKSWFNNLEKLIIFLLIAYFLINIDISTCPCPSQWNKWGHQIEAGWVWCCIPWRSILCSFCTKPITVNRWRKRSGHCGGGHIPNDV